jgi:hypothetical protein
MAVMCAIVFRQIKLRSWPRISWYVLMSIIIEVDVTMPVELQVVVSVPPELNWMFQYL